MVEPLALRVIDSHTGGEPTRVVVDCEIELIGNSMLERREDFRRRVDHLRSGLINEPRGSNVLVGAWLTPATTPGATAGVVFFNNVGYLGMCGHGTIGVVETLRYLGLIGPGVHTFDTPEGPVTAQLCEDGEVALENVASYRYMTEIELMVDGVGIVVGDIAYGGNWFFIVHEPSFLISLARRDELTAITLMIKDALWASGYKGKNGEEIDHIELEGNSQSPSANSRNFMMCPGGAYDRSPCGTGTSAKMACLFASGLLAAGEEYVQESVTGSTFRGSVIPVSGGVQPTIIGRAHVTSDAKMFFSNKDPLRWGLRS